jgi:hypothetical protein
MFSSVDGVTWAQEGGLGPLYDTILGGGPAYMTLYLGDAWIVYVTNGGGLSLAKFSTSLGAWSGVVVDTGFDWAPLQVACLQVSATKLVIFGSPTNTSVNQNAVYSIFDFGTLIATDWVDCGLPGQVGSYPASFPIGIAGGTSGRVHLIGCTTDAVVTPDHLWQQTLYPATGVLIAVNEFESNAQNNDLTLFPVCALSGGRVCVRVSIGGNAGPYTYLVGVSADMIVFAGVVGPALPTVNSQAVGIISNAAGCRVFTMDRLTVPGTPSYQSCSFDGTTFGAFTVIGASATLATRPFPALQGSSSTTNGYWLMSWAGSVFVWDFFAPVVIAPVVGVLGGAVASTPVDYYGAFIGVKRRREC